MFALLCRAPDARAIEPIADTWLEPRTRFANVLSLYHRGQRAQAFELARELEHYPLYPYLVYLDLDARLDRIPPQEIERFVTSYSGTYLGERLRSRWLTTLARRGDWTAFTRHYRPGDSVELACHALTARLRTGGDAALIDDARALWLSGTSRPAACDPAFSALQRQGALDDAVRWQRIKLAFAAGNSGVARFVGARLRAPALRARLALWQRVRDASSAVLASTALDDDQAARDVMLAALERRASEDLDAARAAWRKLAHRFAFSAAEQARALRGLAIAAAEHAHADRLTLLDAIPRSALDDTAQRYRLREGLALAAWPELVRWSADPPQAADERLRWRYWRGYALRALGQDEAARDTWQPLASERDYYGFLAADALAKPYAFNAVPIAPSSTELAALETRSGLRRAREFARLGLDALAAREWAFELARLDRRQVAVAAVLASTWGWPDRAIAALGQISAFDDLDVRFPLLYRTTVEALSRRHSLDLARLFAIVRSESAFNPAARSSAGAIGLMQLLPATAQDTARRTGIHYGGPAQLVDTQTNLALGSAYLARLLDRYSANFTLAAAAYNAGPSRIRAWQPRQCVDARLWIEAIPFAETRSYVRRAFFYTVVYQWRLGLDIRRLEEVMSAIPPRDGDAKACRP